MDNLDLDVVILAHVALTLGAAISVSPAYNLPIALYGLTVAGKSERQFAGLHTISIVLDLMVRRHRAFPSHRAFAALRGIHDERVKIDSDNSSTVARIGLDRASFDPEYHSRRHQHAAQGRYSSRPS